MCGSLLFYFHVVPSWPVIFSIHISKTCSLMLNKKNCDIRRKRVKSSRLYIPVLRGNKLLIPYSIEVCVVQSQSRCKSRDLLSAAVMCSLADHVACICSMIGQYNPQGSLHQHTNGLAILGENRMKIECCTVISLSLIFIITTGSKH